MVKKKKETHKKRKRKQKSNLSVNPGGTCQHFNQEYSKLCGIMSYID